MNFISFIVLQIIKETITKYLCDMWGDLLQWDYLFTKRYLRSKHKILFDDVVSYIHIC